MRSALTARAVTTGFSRFPVYDGDLDDIVGVSHVKDAFGVPYEQRGTTSVRSVMAQPLVVPETMQLSVLLVLLLAVDVFLVTREIGRLRRART